MSSDGLFQSSLCVCVTACDHRCQIRQCPCVASLSQPRDVTHTMVDWMTEKWANRTQQAAEGGVTTTLFPGGWKTAKKPCQRLNGKLFTQTLL